MTHIGNFQEDQSIEIEINFKTAPSGLAVEVRKEGSTSVTTTGVALTTPYDGNSKKALVVITTTDSFYETGKDYYLRASAGTVDSEDITDFVLRSFSIENRQEDTIPVATRTEIDSNSTKLIEILADVTGLDGEAMRGTDNALLASGVPTNFADLAITASTGRITVGTNVDKTGYSISGTKQTLDALNDIAAGTAMTLTSAERTSLAQTMEAAIINELDGTAVMQAIADLIASDMNTGDLSVLAIAAATRDEILNRILSGNHDTSGSVGKVLQDILEDTETTNPATIAASFTALAQQMTNFETAIKGSGWQSTDNLAEIAEDVAGLNGEAMRGTDSANTTAPPTVEAIRIEFDANSTRMQTIEADTNELQTDWANGGRLDTLLDTAAAGGGGGGGGIEMSDSVPSPGTAGTVGRALRQVIDNLDAQISSVGGAVGPGAIETIIEVTVDGLPEDNVAVWISTDEAGTNVIAGTLHTNASGQVTFQLDAGSYYSWKEKSGFNFTSPEAFTVS